MILLQFDHDISRVAEAVPHGLVFSTLQLGQQLTEAFAPEFSLLMKKKILPENIT